LPNSSISFILLSGEFSIEGYRICGNRQYQPIDFQLEAKVKDGEWIEIEKRQDELMKTKFQNSLYSKISFECKEKEIFHSFRLTNLSPVANGTHELDLNSIEFFGQFIQHSPKIVQRTQIESRDSSDRFGVLFYLHIKLSLNEFCSLVLVSA
jgi:hypothetical protein